MASSIQTLKNANLRLHISAELAVLSNRTMCRNCMSSLDYWTSFISHKWIKNINSFQITELKANNFTTENELRQKLKNLQKEHEDKVDFLNNRISNLLKEVASLSKTAKKGKGMTATAAAASTDNNSSGTDSPNTAP